MLVWAFTFFVLTIIAGVLGFGDVVVAGPSPQIGQVLFVIFLVLTVIAFVVRAIENRTIG
jgi:uncharacterized membrane protein YtjA (UPF0391 family)